MMRGGLMYTNEDGYLLYRIANSPLELSTLRPAAATATAVEG